MDGLYAGEATGPRIRFSRPRLRFDHQRPAQHSHLAAERVLAGGVGHQLNRDGLTLREVSTLSRAGSWATNPSGVIAQLGEAEQGYAIGDRVLVGAVTPCGTCFFCQSHSEAQCSGYEAEWRMVGPRRLGNSVDVEQVGVRHPEPITNP